MTTQRIADLDTTKDMAFIRHALEIKKNLDIRVKKYDETCAEYRKQGYRPKYCFHGTYQWTDYDNICGGCEDEVSFRETAKIALRIAHQQRNAR